jgi:hypothetical protein
VGFSGFGRGFFGFVDLHLLQNHYSICFLAADPQYDYKLEKNLVSST